MPELIKHAANRLHWPRTPADAPRCEHGFAMGRCPHYLDPESRRHACPHATFAVQRDAELNDKGSS